MGKLVQLAHHFSFQLTAARRRLVVILISKRGVREAFQLTAARRRLDHQHSGTPPPTQFQLTAARRRLVKLKDE